MTSFVSCSQRESDWSAAQQTARSHFARAYELTSSAASKVSKVGKSALGKIAISGTTHFVGSYIGGSVMPIVAEEYTNSYIAMGLLSVALLAGTVFAYTLGQNQKRDSQRWVAIATVVSLLMMAFLPSMHQNGWATVGEVAGGALAIKLADRVTGTSTQIVNEGSPADSYLGCMVPATAIPKLVESVIPFGPVGKLALNSVLPSLVYYRNPLEKHVVPLLSVEERRRVMNPTYVVKQLLTMAHDDGLEGLAQDWAHGIASSPNMQAYFQDVFGRMLTGQQAYNVFARLLNDFLKDPENRLKAMELVNNPPVEQSDGSWNVLGVSLEMNKLSPVAFKQISQSMEQLADVLAKSLVALIQNSDKKLAGIPLSTLDKYAFLQEFLKEYIHGFLGYSMRHIPGYMFTSEIPLDIQETQLFYHNIVELFGFAAENLYADLPLAQTIGPKIRSALEAVIPIALPDVTGDEEGGDPVIPVSRIKKTYRMILSVLSEISSYISNLPISMISTLVIEMLSILIAYISGKLSAIYKALQEDDDVSEMEAICGSIVLELM